METDRSNAIQSEQNRSRVYNKMKDLIIDFCVAKVNNNNGCFNMSELEKYVDDRLDITPGSPGRIFRALKSLGRITYRVKNRAASEYFIMTVS